MSNYSTGLDAWQKFYNYQKMYHGTKVTYSLDEMLNSYGAIKKDIFINGWGDMISNGNVAPSRLDSALISLARDSQGRYLKNPIQVSSYIQNQTAKIDWVEAFTFVATESAKDIGNGAVAVGNSIITTGKILNFLLPVIVVGFLIFWLSNNSSKIMKMVAIK